MVGEGTPEAGALFDEARAYRYLLWRRWDANLPPAAFILLNPSTADAQRDDPTLRRCAAFARAWGCGGVIVANLFALRATGPRALRSHAEPVGPENDAVLAGLAGRRQSSVTAGRGTPAMLVAGWGNAGRLMDRARAVAALLQPAPLAALGVNRDGSPRHPLYVPASAHLIRLA